MKFLTTAEIREKYLNYFAEKGCEIWPSSSLVPDDPSLLLTSAGMVQFKPYFLQQKSLRAPYIGTTTVQKCVRTNDIEIIGTTGRHLSFFEMLGNFSFGSYFKDEMCAWALEFSTRELGLPQEKIFFTVFTDDDETIEIWKSLGIDEDHISRLGEDDNFWRAGPTGPCGPCSELYFDQGEEFGCGSSDCAPGCDCDRFLEYWNLVFTQYNGCEDGSLEPLPKKNIDTGMGLERIASILQGVQSNYDIDLMRDVIAVGEKLSAKTYGQNDLADLNLRIISDHCRAVTFMIADGILPSNEGRGYVLRRLLRRSVLKASFIGIQGNFIEKFAAKVIELMGASYPELIENKDLIFSVIKSEEDRFIATLRQGENYLEQALENLDSKVLPGDIAFTLHDTYGFPLEITQEIVAENGISVDLESFEKCMDEQKERARKSAKGADLAWSGFGGVMTQLSESLSHTEFLGYTQTNCDATVLAIVQDSELVSHAAAGSKVEIILDKTPCYAEKGGQIGDTGILNNPQFAGEILDTQSPEDGLTVHSVRITTGEVHTNDKVHVQVSKNRRDLICRNHTATHILHHVLQQVLGDHVKQAGSLVTNDRLRFDFTHFQAVNDQEIAQIEKMANEYVMQNHAVSYYETTLAQARANGVTALFGEKYKDPVRVLEINEVSKELCGGTHVAQTSEIGLIKIVSESSVGSNLRRIEALTSSAALDYFLSQEAQLKQTASVLNCPVAGVYERSVHNLGVIKDFEQKEKLMLLRASQGKVAEFIEASVDVGYKLIIANAGELNHSTGLKNIWDIIKGRVSGPCAVVLAAQINDSPILLCAATPEAVALGFNAGAIIKQISPHVKGGGGGKPEMAQAGGKDASGIPAALDAAREILVK